MTKKIQIMTVVSLMFVLTMRCGRYNPASSQLSDDEAINLLISSSGYADFSNYTDDGLSEFPLAAAKGDTFPADIFFRRRIENSSHLINISYDSSGTLATALINTDFRGRLVVDNNQNGVCDTFSRTLDDPGQRYVWFKKWNGRWMVYGASPMTIRTADPADRVLIDSIRIEGDLGLRTYVMFRDPEFGQILQREEMPIFYSGANIILNAWGKVESGTDSCWMFLHLREIDCGVSSHIRWPMTKQDVFEFQASWTSDSTEIPVVRHAAVDMILGATLFEDSTREYSAYILVIPYIITNNDSLP